MKIAKDGDHKRFFKASCDNCGADRGYKRVIVAKQLCRKCATRKSGRKRAIHIYNNVDYKDFIEVNASTKTNKKRISLKYRTKCTICDKDKGYSRAKDFKKPCLSCSRKIAHKNMNPKTKKAMLKKISCTQRKINIKDFDGFSTPEHEKARNKFKSKNLSEQCFSNANYTCDVYGVRNIELHAHHLNSWARYTDQRFDINNLVCMSSEAHKSFHYVYGNGAINPVTAEQYKLFKNNIAYLIKCKQILYLIAGAPSAGKSWICNQLTDHFNYVSYDNVPKWRHIFELLKNNNKPLLYDPTIKVSTFIKRYGHIFNIHLLVIQETEDTLNRRIIAREGKITKTIKRRINRMKILAKHAEFTGTSNEILNYLNKKAQDLQS